MQDPAAPASPSRAATPGLATAPAGAGEAGFDDTIGDIIAEFSEVIAFARNRWSRYAEDVHPELRAMGLMMLQVIIRKGPLSATELGLMLGMDKALVSRQLAKLRELALVEATPAPEDRRVTFLSASAQAHELIDSIRNKWAAAYHERFVGWSGAELAELRAGLRHFNESADRPAPAPTSPSARCAQAQSGTQAQAGAQDQASADG